MRWSTRRNVPLEVEEAEATYPGTLEAAIQCTLEESQREEDARWVGMEEALAMSAVGDCVIPPPSQSSAFLPEPKPEPQPTEHQVEVYQ